MAAPFRISRRTAILAIVLLASYAYFYEGGGWNQNTRFDLVRAITEHHSLQIDRYQDNTGDKAVKDGHYYSDKAPGASLTAVPAVALARIVLRSFGWDLFAPETIGALSYVATVAAAGLPAVIAALCVFWWSREAGAGETGAGLAAIVCGLGTPLWPYATLLYGHALAAGCLMLAFYGAWRADGAAASAVRRWAFLTGLAAGWAVLTEFPASIPAGVIVAATLWNSRRRSRPAAVAAALAAGLSVGAAVLLAYNWAAFGDLFHIGYTSEQAGFDAMKTGLFGVSLPNPRVLLSLIAGPYRGLLPLAPVLIAAPVGWWLWLRDRRVRSYAALAVFTVAYYFLLTSGYAYWDGGWSYGSRHLGPALPFLSIGLAAVWRVAGRWARTIVLALALVSVGASLVAVATTPQPPGGPGAPANPMRDVLWPHFADGHFPLGYQSVLERGAPGESYSDLARRHAPRAAWNAGEKLGLNGHLSLLPLALIWIVGAVLWATPGWRNGALATRRAQADDRMSAR